MEGLVQMVYTHKCRPICARSSAHTLLCAHASTKPSAYMFRRSPREHVSSHVLTNTMYTHMHTCMHTYIHTCIHTHTCINTYICTHSCINTYICTHSCINTYMHTQLHISHTCTLRKSQRRPFHAASFAPPIHMPAALAGLRAAAPPALHPLPPRTHPAGLCRRTSAVPKLHRCDLHFVFRQS